MMCGDVVLMFLPDGGITCDAVALLHHMFGLDLSPLYAAAVV